MPFAVQTERIPKRTGEQIAELIRRINDPRCTMDVRYDNGHTYRIIYNLTNVGGLYVIAPSVDDRTFHEKTDHTTLVVVCDDNQLNASVSRALLTKTTIELARWFRGTIEDMVQKEYEAEQARIRAEAYRMPCPASCNKGSVQRGMENQLVETWHTLWRRREEVPCFYKCSLCYGTGEVCSGHYHEEHTSDHDWGYTTYKTNRWADDLKECANCNWAAKQQYEAEENDPDPHRVK